MLPENIVFTYDKATRQFKNKTDEVKSVRHDGRYIKVQYTNGEYPFLAENVKVFPLRKQVEMPDMYLIEIEAIGDYGEYFGIIRRDRRNLEIVERAKIHSFESEIKSKVLFSYFKSIASISDNSGILNKKGEPLLLQELNKISLGNIEETVLGSYFTGELIEVNNESEAIYPFSVNASQKQAIKKVFTNNISVIQGPPGTGKTQTILNIVANIVLKDKTVGVISNNNSAVENVIEKLEKYGYGFLIAKLGNRDNQNNFFGVSNLEQEQQGGLIDYANTPIQIDPSWKKEKRQIKQAEKDLAITQASVDKLLDSQIMLSIKRAELIRLQKELEHFLDGGKPSQPESAAIRKLASKNAVWLTDLKTEVSNLTLLKIKRKGLLWRIKLSFRHLSGKVRFGNAFSVLHDTPDVDELRYLDYLIYTKLVEQCKNDIARFERAVEGQNLGELLARSEELSKVIFNHHLYNRYEKASDTVFGKESCKKNFDEFTRRFPVITSTTHSIQSSVGDNILDYIIIDESSQVDIVTASLAFAKCRNVIVVGDSRQLPHIVGEKENDVRAITESMNITPEYNYVDKNIIDSLRAVYGDKLPITLLREHYRCNPIIIEYCNRKYYNGELVVMTKGVSSYDSDNFPMRLVRTKETNVSCQNNTNTRQADVIREEILPWFGTKKYGDIGIVSPYKNQVDYIAKNVCADTAVEVDTIHKFQGREKDIIIFSTVKPKVTTFLDDPNLINVAVSRAKEQFILVAREDYELQHGSNIGDLIRYIRYFNPHGDYESKIVSVFDLLHRVYSDSLERYRKRHPNDFRYASEDYMNNVIQEVISEGDYTGITVCHNYPLRYFIYNHESLGEREREFAMHVWSHVDFLLVNSCDNSPILAIEVDGGIHREDPKQQERDNIKNSVLKKNGIHLLRLPTNGHGEKDKLASALSSLIAVSD